MVSLSVGENGGILTVNVFVSLKLLLDEAVMQLLLPARVGVIDIVRDR